MSIVAYTGLPRSGKSYGVVENVIIPALKDGRTVVTNIPLRIGYLQEDFPKGKVVQFDTGVDRSFWDIDKQPRGAVFVIDECWRYWPSGTKANAIPEKEKQFFTEHGHVVGDDGKTNEIILVTQDLNQVAAFLRDLVEETYIARKLSAVGQSRKFRVDLYARAATGSKPRGAPLRQFYGTYKEEIYKYYISHTHNKTTYAAGMEEKPDQRGNIFKSPLFYIGLPLAVVVIVFCVSSLYSFFRPDISVKEETIPQPDSGAPIRPVGTSMPPGQYVKTNVTHPHVQWQLDKDLDVNRLPLSDEWRIVGVINDTYILSSERRGERFIHQSKCAGFVTTREQFCVIGGRLVTWYSAERYQPVDDRVNAAPEFNFGGES